MSPEIITRLVYPDPFKPVGLEFELPEDAVVTVRITDASGSIIATLTNNAEMRKGTHRVFVPTNIQVRVQYLELAVSKHGNTERILRKI